MTKNSILLLKPSKELNSLVAQVIFGFEHYIGNNIPEEHIHERYKETMNQEVWIKKDIKGFWHRYCSYCGNLPSYSENITDAWSVVEYVQQIYPYWRFCLLGGDRDFGYNFEAEWFGENDPAQDYGNRHGKAYGKTVSEAICKASLIAILGLNEK